MLRCLFPPPSTTTAPLAVEAVTCSPHHYFCGLKNRDAYDLVPFASCILGHWLFLPVDALRFCCLSPSDPFPSLLYLAHLISPTMWVRADRASCLVKQPVSTHVT
ncbi:hypothetical protein XPA_001402 [Xanthoria parietina]